MEIIRKKYAVDEQHRKVSVQINIDDDNRIEQVPGDDAPGQFMQKNDPSEALDIAEARKLYARMKYES